MYGERREREEREREQNGVSYLWSDNRTQAAKFSIEFLSLAIFVSVEKSNNSTKRADQFSREKILKIIAKIDVPIFHSMRIIVSRIRYFRE